MVMGVGQFSSRNPPGAAQRPLPGFWQRWISEAWQHIAFTMDSTDTEHASCLKTFQEHARFPTGMFLNFYGM